MGCPSIRSNVIPGVSVKVFPMRLTFDSVDSAEQVALSDVGGSHPIKWQPE